MSRLTITADDFGLCPEVNDAICMLHDRGIVQRTSFLTNTPHFDASVCALRLRPQLEVAIHLNLTDGAPVLVPRNVPTLVNSLGQFRGGRHYSVVGRICAGSMRPNEINMEWIAQITRAKQAAIDVLELNSHGHMHLLPPLHGVVVDLLEQFAIPRVRVLSGTSWRGTVFGACSRRLIRAVRRRSLPVSFGDRILGLGSQGGLDESHLAAVLKSAQTAPAELVVHPAVGGNPYHQRWGYKGEVETHALLNAPAIRLAARQVNHDGSPFE